MLGVKTKIKKKVFKTNENTVNVALPIKHLPGMGKLAKLPR